MYVCVCVCVCAYLSVYHNVNNKCNVQTVDRAAFVLDISLKDQWNLISVAMSRDTYIFIYLLSSQTKLVFNRFVWKMVGLLKLLVCNSRSSVYDWDLNRGQILMRRWVLVPFGYYGAAAVPLNCGLNRSISIRFLDKFVQLWTCISHECNLQNIIDFGVVIKISSLSTTVRDEIISATGCHQLHQHHSSISDKRCRTKR